MAPQRYAVPSPAAVAGILLDSDVIIDALRGRLRTLAEIRAVEQEGIATYCCALSWAEIFAGLRAGEEPTAEAFFQARHDVVLDAVIGRRAGQYLFRYAKSHGLKIADALVGAAASTTGLRLWTVNRRHYPMEDVRFYEPSGS